MDGVLGLLLLRYSSNILHTPKIKKKTEFYTFNIILFFIPPPLYNNNNYSTNAQPTVTPNIFTKAMQEKTQTSLGDPWDQGMSTY